MVTAVTQYKTADGRMFPSESLALSHEKSLPLRQWLQSQDRMRDAILSTEASEEILVMLLREPAMIIAHLADHLEDKPFNYPAMATKDALRKSWDDFYTLRSGGMSASKNIDIDLVIHWLTRSCVSVIKALVAAEYRLPPGGGKISRIE